MKTASIVVTFNPDLVLLHKQLESVSKFTTVFLVDNSSLNINEIESICKSISCEIIIIKFSDNKGLGFAQNTGIKEAEKRRCSHVILFDQDSYLSRDSFEKLVECEKILINNKIKVGAIGPICIDPITKTKYPITEYRGPFIVRKYLSDDELCQASFIISSGSLIRIEVLKDIGLMKDDFFIDYIDVEWCYRAQSLGYKLYATNESVLEHIIGDARVNFLGRSISMHSATRRYYLTRNCLFILTMSHIPFGYKIREITLLFARIIAFIYFSKERSRYSKLIIKALSDAIRGRYGKLNEVN